jgi:CBS domain-containing protein
MEVPMIAKNIMGRVKAPKKSANLREVALRLLSEEYSSLPVVDDDGSVVGIISEFDILKAMAAGKDLEGLTTADAMSTSPLCVEEGMPVEKLIEVMIDKHLLRVPVLRDGKLAGTVSRRNILDSRLILSGDYWVLKDSD